MAPTEHHHGQMRTCKHNKMVSIIYMLILWHCKQGACTEIGCFVLTVQSLFLKVEAGTPWRGNYVLEKHLDTIERTAFNKGLPPEGIDIMIDFALGLRMGKVELLSCIHRFSWSFFL